MYLAFATTELFICRPLNSFWDPTTPGHCYNVDIYYRIVNCLNVVADISVLVLPIRPILALQMPAKRKAGYLAVFMSKCASYSCILQHHSHGYRTCPYRVHMSIANADNLVSGLGTVASIVRAVQFFRFSSKIVEPQYSSALLTPLVVEPCVYSICVCLAGCGHLLSAAIASGERLVQRVKQRQRTVNINPGAQAGGAAIVHGNSREQLFEDVAAMPESPVPGEGQQDIELGELSFEQMLRSG